MNMKQIENLSDNSLISEYRMVREIFLKIKPFSSKEEEIERVYNLIIREVRKRSLESLTMYM